MKKYFLFLLIILTGNQLLIAQTEKLITGKIICENKTVANIQITNLVNEKSTVSDQNGNFSILAKAEDMLVFTSINYDYKRKFLEQDDINKNNLIIVLTKKIEELDEVIVSKEPKLDAVKLGILSKPAKEYTVAERRLRTATSGGGLIPLDPIINLITGRTKKLKNQIEIEKKEMLLTKISYLYKDEYYINKLKIAPDLIQAFQYFAIEDAKLATEVKSKNKFKINFRMLQLAQDFNKLQKVTK